MRAVILMFDSLNRHFLSPYRCTWTHTPNFARLAGRSATFDRSYVCSMPCMPARRDLHTGRPGFLHRHWAPLEPFDVSVFDQLRSGRRVQSHLASDHYHYWEDGGANYHCRYNTWEFFRGQEGDAWIGQVADPHVPDNINGKSQRQDWINRPFLQHDADHCQTKTIRAGLDFIDRNASEDNWLLQIECFDPHEPFFCDRQWKDLFPDPDDEKDAPLYDWPEYGQARHGKKEIDRARRHYAALLAKCDASLGHVLDAFDRHNLWDDTMLVVWTDHGMLLGEHGCMMKNDPPLYEEVSHTPFFVWDPRSGVRGERRRSLIQPAIDLPVTLCNFFGGGAKELLPDAIGYDLTNTIASDQPVREAAIFGYFNLRVNLVTDRYAYYRGAPAGTPLCPAYTLTTSRMRGHTAVETLQGATLADPLPFSRGVRPMRIPGDGQSHGESTLLFDLHADPAQKSPIDDPNLHRELDGVITRLMREASAPAEQYERMGLS